MLQRIRANALWLATKRRRRPRPPVAYVPPPPIFTEGCVIFGGIVIHTVDAH